jgi:hypothetical protein
MVALFGPPIVEKLPKGTVEGLVKALGPLALAVWAASVGWTNLNRGQEGTRRRPCLRLFNAGGVLGEHFGS